ncbi:MAG TPA: CPBP family intramembrane glutamic endopeptidase [Chitinophagaceae bacterium]|nr:CPBP family intramembrane glutamic endopeptidase [Chitinophagaceae bacterium]
MYDIHSRPGTSYGRGLLILFGSVFVGLFLGSLISFGLWPLMTGKSVMSIQTDMSNPAYANALRVLQVVSTFFTFVVPTLVMANLLSKKPYDLLGFNFYFGPNQVVLTILIMVASLPLVGALGELNKMIPLSKGLETYFKELESAYAEQIKGVARITGLGDYLISLVVMALAPAFFEELFFRGGVQNLLQRSTKNPWLSIVVTSIIFSAIHLSYYGFLPRFALGMVLGMFFYYSGSLWLPILGHFFQNAMVVTQLFIYQKQGKSVEEAMNETFPLWWGLIGIAALVFLFSFFRKNADHDRKTRMPAETVALEDKWMT